MHLIKKMIDWYIEILVAKIHAMFTKRKQLDYYFDLDFDNLWNRIEEHRCDTKLIRFRCREYEKKRQKEAGDKVQIKMYIPKFGIDLSGQNRVFRFENKMKAI